MSTNNLADVTELKNNYLGLRHGVSIANKKKLIVSRKVNGIKPEYALDTLGREQIVATAREALDAGTVNRDTLIFSSIMSRTAESAEIFRRVIGAAGVIYLPEMIERDFGDFELQSDEHYADVWEEDRKDPDHTRYGVESANSVQDRSTGVVRWIEGQVIGQDIVLSGHGDWLQILQTGFQKVSAARHRELPHFDNAALRPLTLAA
jgi:broad specificity phosphatase PhoE